MTKHYTCDAYGILRGYYLSNVFFRPSKEYHRPEKSRQARDQSPEETGMAGAGHYYHYAAAPLQQHESPR